MIAISDVTSHWVVPTDDNQILCIEKQLFADPLTQDNLKEMYSNPECIGRVYEVQKEYSAQVDWKIIVGYVIFHSFNNSYYLCRIGVHPDFQHQGIGRKILQDLLRRAKQRKRKRLYAFVTESDMQTLYFLKACGWKAIRVVRGGGKDEDGIEIELIVPSRK